MTDSPGVPVASSSTVELRRTLIVGGILLIVSAALTYASPQVLFLPDVARAVIFWAGAITFSAALLIYGFGLGRTGSLVARGPLALTAIVVLAAWPFVERILTFAVPFTTDVSEFYLAWGWISTGVRLAAAIIIVVRIARAGVVRGSLRWMPLWALVAVVAPQVLAQLVIAALGVDLGRTDVDGVWLFFGLGQLTAFAAPLALGILSILYARRAAPEPVQVYPPV